MNDRPQRVKKQDRTGVWISVAVHLGALGIVVVILLTTEVGQQLIRGGLKAFREDNKVKPVKQVQPQQTETKARKVVTDAPPPASGGRRVTDAPAAVGDSFFSEAREKKTGAALGGDGGQGSGDDAGRGPV